MGRVLRAALALREALGVGTAFARRTTSRVSKTTVALSVLALLMAAPASAEPGFEYGEVTRFGGFDSSAYNGGQFGGEPTPGAFLDPTGFAVDPVDDTVYVVDRTSRYAHNPTSWRIQQFSPKGALEGATMFTLPNGNFGRNSAIEGLAVDHRAGRLYALVAGSPPAGQNNLPPVAQELLAWSTEPVAGGLVAATVAGAEEKLPPDEVGSPLPGSPGTVGGLVSSKTQLLSGATPLYGPQGIAVDPLEIPGVDNPVTVEASDLLPNVGAGRPIPGDTIVQQVRTQAEGTTIATGDLLASWSGASVAGQLGGSSWGPLGIATGPDGTLTVLLDSGGSVTDAYVVSLKADFSEAAVLDSPADMPLSGDFDEAPLWIEESPFASTAGVGISNLDGAGPEVAHLSSATSGGTGGPYAAIMFSNESSDIQVGVNAPADPEYWRPGNNAPFEANIGVRLLEPGAGGAISSLQGRTIVNTLGNASRLGPCHISASEATLAAGADGTLWILDRGPRSDQSETSGQGREVIELAPGAELPPGAELCPQPAGTFTMTPAGGSSKSGEETLTVPAGTKVTFDANSINRQHGRPFAYEWDLDGNATNGPVGDGFEKVYEMRPIHYYYPPSGITYMYTKPGTYKVRVRMRTDYGVYTPPEAGTVIVTAAVVHPEARFTATSSGGQQVTFNAAESTPGIGSIVDYHWSWGDGGEEDEGPQTPVVAHVYAQPGGYRVTLKVTNSSFQSATSAPWTVTVTAPPPPVRDVLAGPLYAIPPVAYPLPAPAPDRTSTRLSPRVRFVAGALNVALSCPAAKILCVGTVRVATAGAVAAGARTLKGGVKRVLRKLLIGEARFSLSGGQHKTVSIRLSGPMLTLLKKLKRLAVMVTVTARDSLGDPGVTRLRLTLKAPPAPRPRQRHV